MGKYKIITFEEHYTCPMVSPDAPQATRLGQDRIDWMDEQGVDVQVLSYGDGSPGERRGGAAVDLCRRANDSLADAMARYPGRLEGFATLPLDRPDAAVQELERCVKDLHFRGAALKATLGGGEFPDEIRFRPVFQKAAELGVPVLFHPSPVVTQVRMAYYSGESLHPMVSQVLSGPGMGWHYEAGVAVLRQILSGNLDRYPGLQLIVGHWGEMLPYYFERLDMVFRGLPPEKTGLTKDISEYFKEHVYVMPSGMFSEGDMSLAFRNCLELFGEDRILWSVDYPYRLQSPLPNVGQWMEELDLPDEQKEKIAHLNGEKLLGLHREKQDGKKSKKK